MPSAPLLRQVNAIILEKGGFAPIYERVAAGEKLEDIARDYTPPGREKPISRPWFYWVITKRPEMKAAYKAAMAQKAYTLVDEAQDILDNVVVDRDEIAKAKLRADIRTWQASRINREQFGEPEKGGVNVTINTQDLHLNALRAARSSLVLPGSGTAALPVKAADVVAIEEPEHGEDHPTPAAG